MSTITIYHNPRCSKSRQTLALLEENGITPQIIAYLEHPPSKKQLKHLIDLLDIPARSLLRTGEPEYKAMGLDDETVTDEQLITAMHDVPKLIERPIVVRDNKAVLGRPPENVLALISG